VAEAVPYWHVDAFADRLFSGNQAAMMVFDAWPDDATLAAIAAENLFAETAFLVADEGGGSDEDGAAAWALRWFTPTQEVRLCGHATLASGHVLLTRDGGESVRFRTRESGILEVRRAGAGYELALPAIAVARADLSGAAALLGGPAPQRMWRSPLGYSVFLYASAREVRGLHPSFRDLAGLGSDLFIATAPADDDAPGTSGGADIVSRAFAPGVGVDEDSVTGSAHAVLAPLWADMLGRSRFDAFQASPRGGRLSCRLDSQRVWLGGGCVTVVAGSFYL
jgi:predicted PhzF superfamily epimerase YddE/YHI9